MNKYKEQLLYLVFGVLTTVVNFAIYFALIPFITYEIANAIAIFSAILFAYVTNKIWVFKSVTNKLSDLIKEFSKFISCRFLSAMFDMASMIILIDFVKTTDLIAKCFTAVIVVLLNYLFSKIFIFKAKK